MRNTCVLAMALLGTAWALPSQETQQQLDQKLTDIDSRRGIEIGGNIKSIFLRSAFASEQDINAYDISPDTDREGFSQLDLKLGFRPQQQTRANLVMRLQAGYQDFFNAGAKTVSIPWMNVEGQISDNFYWVVGDFRQQYSALSLSSHDVEVLYEPEIYRRNRHMAREQVYLQDNQRNLQGANAQFRTDLGGFLGAVRAEALFSRLRRLEVLDFSGATGNILPNEPLRPGASQSSGMDKLLYGGNLEWLPASQNLLIGVTPLFIQDLRSTQAYITRELDDGSTQLQPINPGVLGPENASVMTGRVGADIASLLGNSSLVADLVAEYAMSSDDAYFYNAAGSVESKAMSGSALLADLNVGMRQESSWMANLNVKYLMNDSNWYNPLVQSPSFFARRVMHADKDGNLLKQGALSPLYSTFDALYHFNPKFSPVGQTLMADPTTSDQTESYNIAPFALQSYTTGVYTRDELALINSMNDPYLTAVLPNGVATANRVGPRAHLTAGYGKDNAIEVQVLFTMLSEASAVGGAKADFSEMGGGLRADLGSLLGMTLPIELSGSYRMSGVKRASYELASNFINSGFYAKFHKRFGFAAGLQMINSEFTNPLAIGGVALTKSEQMQWMAGLDYSLARNAWLALNFGRIDVTNTYAMGSIADPTQVLLPEYITADMAAQPEKYTGRTTLEHSFGSSLVEATINVDF